MTLRRLCLLTLLIFAAPLKADDKPAQPPAPPAAANATAEVPASDKPVADKPLESPSATQSAPSATQPVAPVQPPEVPLTPAVLEQRINALLKDPGPMIDRVAVQNQLDLLTDNASQLALMSDDPRKRFDALSVQLQSIYTRLIEYPDSSDVDHLLGRLRAAARRIKAIDLRGELPGAVGDFWLLTAELYDMNRMKLPLEARRQQAAGLMKDFLAKHADWPAAMDVREAMETMNKN